MSLLAIARCVALGSAIHAKPLAAPVLLCLLGDVGHWEAQFVPVA